MVCLQPIHGRRKASKAVKKGGHCERLSGLKLPACVDSGTVAAKMARVLLG